MTKAFQDYYPENLSHCYGCGVNNKQGHQLKSYWHKNSDNGAEQTIAHFTPKEYHTAIPNFVYGGLLASLIDCHGTGSAAAISYKKANRAMDTEPVFRFVTAALNINYLAPTPMGVELTLIGTFIEIKEKKVIVDIEVIAQGKVCVQGQVIAVKMPVTMT